MKLVVLFIFLSVSQPLKAQWSLIYKSQDIDSVWSANILARVDTPNPITLIEPRGKLSKFLIVRYAHSKRKLIATKSVWGFTDSTNSVWRYTDGDLCRVVNYNGYWVEYAIYRTFYKRSSKPEVYYEPGYSRTLDGKVENGWQKAMRDIPSELILRKGKN